MIGSKGPTGDDSVLIVAVMASVIMKFQAVRVSFPCL